MTRAHILPESTVGSRFSVDESRGPHVQNPGHPKGPSRAEFRCSVTSSSNEVVWSSPETRGPFTGKDTSLIKTDFPFNPSDDTLSLSFLLLILG